MEIHRYTHLIVTEEEHDGGVVDASLEKAVLHIFSSLGNAILLGRLDLKTVMLSPAKEGWEDIERYKRSCMCTFNMSFCVGKGFTLATQAVYKLSWTRKEELIRSYRIIMKVVRIFSWLSPFSVSV